MEDYLKAIFTLEGEGARATTQILAEAMDVAPASVTNMLKRLSEAELVAYAKYQGVELTDSGRRVAAEIVRHHRLLELYLTQALGFSWDEVHAEAERLEHFISEELEARIDAELGFPSHDPHGEPIPTLEGHLPRPEDHRLVDQPTGLRLEVVRVRDEDPGALRGLADAGIFPGVTVEVVPSQPGGMTIRVGEQVRRLTDDQAGSIRVRSADPDEGLVVTADHLDAGRSGRILRVRARGSRLARLRELGVREGRSLRGVQGSGPGSPAIFDLEGQPLTLTREEARSILVSVEA